MTCCQSPWNGDIVRRQAGVLLVFPGNLPLRLRSAFSLALSLTYVWPWATPVCPLNILSACWG